MKNISDYLYVGLSVFLLTTQSQAQPVLSHLNGTSVNTAIKGTPHEHYWSKCVSAGRANEGIVVTNQ